MKLFQQALPQNHLERILAVLLLVVTIGVYWQVLYFSFISLDDPDYILNNPHVRNGITLPGAWWAFTTFYADNWHPLAWLSHMLDVQLFGLLPAGHHMTNVIFHAVNTLLVFLLLNETTKARWQSFIVAALFALHPLHIESVAWIAERKDVLCAFFWLLTMLCYVRYVRSLNTGWYLGSILCFILGLMSKPMIVTLPVVLILFDVWPLGRLRLASFPTPDRPIAPMPPVTPISFQRILYEKIPFALLTIAASILTYVAQNWRGGVQTWDALPVKERLLNAGYSYFLYIYKMFWPFDLAVFYPHPGASLGLWLGMAPVAGICAVSVLIVLNIRRTPYAFTGWFWFLGTLVPVIGIVQVGGQGMADRYTYLPLIGLFLVLVWGLSEFLQQVRVSLYLKGIMTAAAFLALVSVTSWQLTHWKNSYNLFSHALAVTRGNYKAHYALAMLDAQQGKLDSYKKHYQRAVEINPKFVARMQNRAGYSLFQVGRMEESIDQFKSALRLNPEYINAAINLGVALAKRGRFDEAILQFEDVLRKNPEDRSARESLYHARREKAALFLRGTPALKEEMK